MVIELNLSGVQFGLKLYAYDFRPKLHNTKFNYHFITSVLKTHRFKKKDETLFFVLDVDFLFRIEDVLQFVFFLQFDWLVNTNHNI